MATEEEVLAVTGCVIGTVTPIGQPTPLRLLADVSVFQPEEVSIGSGIRGTALILKSADLRQALGKVEIDTLSTREREVLKLLAEGKKAQEIGHALYISVFTVRRHRHNGQPLDP
jgi:DNA-binding NarL/FixJ family response regulator